jgi:hypothetical protein
MNKTYFGIIAAIFCLQLQTLAQGGYLISAITSEIVSGDITKPLRELHPTIAGGVRDVDIDENIYYQLRNNNVANPATPLPIGCFVEKIEYIVRYKDKVFGPFEIPNANIPQGTAGSRYFTTARTLLGKVKTEVLDKLTSRNISDLQIIFKGIWLLPANVSAVCQAINGINGTETRTDVFTLNVRKFGLIALVDFSPLSQDGTGKTLDVVSGLFKNLARTSLDYVSVLNEPSFSNAMVSVPFLKYEGRNWFSKNTELEAVFVTDLANDKKDVAFGVGIGILGVTDKTIKAGVFWQNGPYYFVGISIRALGIWLSNYK